MTDERASVKGQRFFVDVGEPMKHSNLGGNNCAVIFVDDYTRFKIVEPTKKKSGTTVVLLALIADYITPQKLPWYRSSAYRRQMVANLKENFSSNWTSAASRTCISHQAQRSTTGWLNERLNYCERRRSPYWRS